MEIHVLETSVKKNGVVGGAQVAFHITTPTGTNSAGKTWVEIMSVVRKNTDLAGVTSIRSVVDSLEQTEIDALEVGALVEEVEFVRFTHPNLSAIQRQAEIVDAYVDFIAPYKIRLQELYAFWGASFDR